jgi:hypothetical protein
MTAGILIFGVAYLMDKRQKGVASKVQVPLGPIGQLLLWVSRGILAVTILAVVGSFVLNEVVYAKLAWYFLFAYIISGFVFQIARHNRV